MKYGISFHEGRGFKFLINKFPSITLWWGIYAWKLTVYGWKWRIITWDMEKNWPPDHDGLEGVFVGVVTSKEYPVYDE